MRIAVLLSVPFMISLSSAQPPAIDTAFIRDYSVTGGFMLGRPMSARPTPDGKAVLFLRSPPRARAMHLFEFDVASKQTRELLTPADILRGAEETLSPEEKARRERMRVTTRGFTSFQLSDDGSRLLVQLSGRLYLVGRADKKVQELPTGKGTLVDPKFSPDGKQLGYVLDHDVYVMDLATLKERRVTTGGTEDVSHGLAEFVAQEEMSRFSGWWWSPDCRWIAFEEADAREVEVWRAADPMKPGEDAHPQRYPRPGRKNVKVRLGIVPVHGERTAAASPAAWVNWNRERYPYLATVVWPKAGPLTILVQNRTQREEVLLAVKAPSANAAGSPAEASLPRQWGETTTLLTERDDAWLNLDQNFPSWLANGSGFLWLSEHEGGPQVELRDPAGKLIRVVIEPRHGFSDLVRVDELNRHVYFAGGPNPTMTHLFRAPLDDGGEVVQLTQAPGVHGAVFSKNRDLQIRRFTGPGALPRATVHAADGSLLGELPSVAESPPFMPNVEFTSVLVPVDRQMIAKGIAATGRYEENFHCSLIRPRDFDAKKKYPVIVYVYGGPTSQVVVQAVGRNLLLQWLADQGFIVVSTDNRGTPRRSREWERSIVGSFGRIPLDDQVAALQALGKKHPELDLTRVGITGWSFGGYMAALAVLRRPDVFKAAVAGAPVVDWEDYDTHYTERYLGLPKDNQQGYKESNLLTYAADLQRPLLLVHGTADDNVFFLHSLKLSDALFRAGKEHELLPLSGLTHMVPDPQVRQRLEERVVRFFKRHL
jgi:dipeptidyl-peptidase-4